MIENQLELMTSALAHKHLPVLQRSQRKDGIVVTGMTLEELERFVSSPPLKGR